eukprot:13860827-Alexandrium_andersonii.AAC.1
MGIQFLTPSGFSFTTVKSSQYWMRPSGLAPSAGGRRLAPEQGARATVDAIAGFVLTLSGGRGPS